MIGLLWSSLEQGYIIPTHDSVRIRIPLPNTPSPHSPYLGFIVLQTFFFPTITSPAAGPKPPSLSDFYNIGNIALAQVT